MMSIRKSYPLCGKSESKSPAALVTLVCDRRHTLELLYGYLLLERTNMAESAMPQAKKVSSKFLPFSESSR
jgi:hypothetical protein